MRQIATLPDGDAARRLADYLLTLKIETRLEQQPDGWIIWVCDEDRVAQARQEFAEFTRNPQDARFSRAARTAHELRLRELEEEEDYRQRLTEFRKQMTEPAQHPRTVTAFLLAAAVVVTLYTNFGQMKDGYVQLLPISSEPGPYLTQIAHGEVWRLITPIFIHVSIVHLFFNCMVMASLAGQVERLQGSPRLIWLVLVFAVLSNLTQFYFGNLTINLPLRITLRPDAHFGGLSGVAYGLFGYVWMKSRLEPQLGLEMTSTTAVIMIVWFFACLTGMMGPIANAAHAAGLVLGLAIGSAPHLWQTLRKH
jgi:GlpG protein